MPKTATATAKAPAGIPHGLTRDQVLHAYQTMLTARRIDEKHLILLKQGKTFFHIGGSGHEAAQVAAALALRSGHDWPNCYYVSQHYWRNS